MRHVVKLTAALALALSGCGVRPPAPPDIYVMRHLDTPAGVSDPDLTPQGRQRAESLVRWFRRHPPAVIHVSSARRALQTAAPLARSLGLTPRVYDPSNSAALVATVARETSNVLVIGHSNTVPDIIARLGGQRPAPLVHADFGDIWKIDGRTRATTRSTLAAPIGESRR